MVTMLLWSFVCLSIGITTLCISSSNKFINYSQFVKESSNFSAFDHTEFGFGIANFDAHF